MNNFEKVAEFMNTFGQTVRTSPEFPEQQVVDLRMELIDEEFNVELREAVQNKDIVGVADALTDILYVVYGMGHTMGIDLQACFDEVHRSNMSKLGEDGKPIYREDGKVLKGPNYTPPDLHSIILG